LSTENSTNWVPGWRPFQTNLIDFSSQADFQLNSSPTSYFTPLHSTELLTTVTAARLLSSFYNLGADASENTASKNLSIAVMAVA
jgi:hypothetical protein